MNKFLHGFLTAFIIIMVVGCSSILNNNEGVFGKASKKASQIDADVRHIENAQAQTSEDKLTRIGAWSQGGIKYSLDQIKTNIPQEVKIAKQMNERVEALAGKPDFNEVKEIEGIVDDLLSQVADLRNKGEKDLAAKDKEILKLAERVKQLNYQREEEIAGAFAQAKDVALKADQYKATLNQMDEFFGLGAVFYGLKKFVVSAAWILGIGSIVFLLLRAFAATNPFVGSIFAIVERVASWFINIIKMLAPRSTVVAGLVEKKTFDEYKGTLNKIIDSIEIVKERQSAVSKAAKDDDKLVENVTPKSVIEDILAETSKTMDQSDKDRVTKAKRDMMWT